MSFKVNINKEYFHKVLEISEGKYSPDEMERILVEDLRKRIHVGEKLSCLGDQGE